MRRRWVDALRDLENDLQFDRGAERKARDAIHHASRVLLFAEDLLQELRSAIGDFRLIADITGRRDEHAEPDDPRHSIE